MSGYWRTDQQQQQQANNIAPAYNPQLLGQGRTRTRPAWMMTTTESAQQQEEEPQQRQLQQLPPPPPPPPAAVAVAAASIVSYHNDDGSTTTIPPPPPPPGSYYAANNHANSNHHQNHHPLPQTQPPPPSYYFDLRYQKWMPPPPPQQQQPPYHHMPPTTMEQPPPPQTNGVGWSSYNDQQQQQQQQNQRDPPYHHQQQQQQQPSLLPPPPPPPPPPPVVPPPQPHARGRTHHHHSIGRGVAAIRPAWMTSAAGVSGGAAITASQFAGAVPSRRNLPPPPPPPAPPPATAVQQPQPQEEPSVVSHQAGAFVGSSLAADAASSSATGVEDDPPPPPPQPQPVGSSSLQASVSPPVQDEEEYEEGEVVELVSQQQFDDAKDTTDPVDNNDDGDGEEYEEGEVVEMISQQQFEDAEDTADKVDNDNGGDGKEHDNSSFPPWKLAPNTQGDGQQIAQQLAQDLQQQGRQKKELPQKAPRKEPPIGNRNQKDRKQQQQQQQQQQPPTKKLTKNQRQRRNRKRRKQQQQQQQQQQKEEDALPTPLPTIQLNQKTLDDLVQPPPSKLPVPEKLSGANKTPALEDLQDNEQVEQKLLQLTEELEGALSDNDLWAIFSRYKQLESWDQRQRKRPLFPSDREKRTKEVCQAASEVLARADGLPVATAVAVKPAMTGVRPGRSTALNAPLSPSSNMEISDEDESPGSFIAIRPRIDLDSSNTAETVQVAVDDLPDGVYNDTTASNSYKNKEGACDTESSEKLHARALQSAPTQVPSLARQADSQRIAALEEIHKGSDTTKTVATTPKPTEEVIDSYEQQTAAYEDRAATSSDTSIAEGCRTPSASDKTVGTTAGPWFADNNDSLNSSAVDKTPVITTAGPPSTTKVLGDKCKADDFKEQNGEGKPVPAPTVEEDLPILRKCPSEDIPENLPDQNLSDSSQQNLSRGQGIGSPDGKAGDNSDFVAQLDTPTKRDIRALYDSTDRMQQAVPKRRKTSSLPSRDAAADPKASTPSKKAKGALSKAKAKLKKAMLAKKKALEEKRAANQALLRTNVYLRPINALLKGGLDSLLIKGINASGPPEQVRFGKTVLLEDQVAGPEDVSSAQKDSALASASLDRESSPSLDQAMALTKRKLELKRKLIEAKEMREKLKASMIERGQGGERVEPSQDASGDYGEDLGQFADAEEGGDLEQKPPGKTTREEEDDDLDKKPPAKPTRQELLKRKKEAERNRAISHFRRLVTKQERLLSQQESDVKETTLKLLQCQKELLAAKTKLRDVGKEIPILGERKIVLDELMAETLSELVKKRKLLHDRKKEQIGRTTSSNA